MDFLSLLEILGTVFGLMAVYLTVRVNIWCWPTGLLCVTFYGILFYEIKLYADALLQAFYFVTNLLGWWHWLKRDEKNQALAITQVPRHQWLLLLPLSFFGILIVGYLFSAFTDAHIPYWDATASGLSVTAQLLMVRKKIENWIFWIVVNLLSIGIYIYKEVYLTSFLYFVFLILAIKGHLEWQKVRRSVYEHSAS